MYTYRHYDPFAWPGAYDDAHRAREFEHGDVTYALLQANPPYDDDSMLLRWDGSRKRWIVNFALVIRGGTYPTGDPIKDQTESGERAALVLLGHFGLEKRANEFTPEEVGSMSPECLIELARR